MARSPRQTPPPRFLLPPEWKVGIDSLCPGGGLISHATRDDPCLALELGNCTQRQCRWMIGPRRFCSWARVHRQEPITFIRIRGLVSIKFLNWKFLSPFSLPFRAWYHGRRSPCRHVVSFSLIMLCSQIFLFFFYAETGPCFLSMSCRDNESVWRCRGRSLFASVSSFCFKLHSAEKRGHCARRPFWGASSVQCPSARWTAQTGPISFFVGSFLSAVSTSYYHFPLPARVGQTPAGVRAELFLRDCAAVRD